MSCFKWIILAALSLALPARADILIGQTTGLTGPVAAGVKETQLGAQLYLDAINAQGGVHGQKVRLLTLDDQFEAAKAANNAETLITQNKVLALFLSRGTATTEAMLPLVERYGVPLIAPSSGAQSLYEPVKKQVFIVRTPYRLEAAQTIVMMSKMGASRIGVVYQDDAFGADGLAGAKEGFKELGFDPAFVDKIDRSAPNFAPISKRLARTDVQSVLIIASAKWAAQGIVQMRDEGITTQFASLSNNASEGFIKLLGKHAKGVIVAQVFPYERSVVYPMVKEAAKLLKGQKDEAVTPSILEGLAAAKVLVGALRAAGPNPSRSSLQTALEGLHKFDVGGLDLSYGPNDHRGLSFVELSIISGNGTFLR
ncbi:ABC transporter substrate-binding protein [Uliginosibacterium sediminicola]|uniref:ABC transporter substrate-binding protein n=1 Tax=Uliginosibacterium sediminicola TaxID=2024550 RepID=A0ABU9Z3U4_9RHOO